MRRFAIRAPQANMVSGEDIRMSIFATNTIFSVPAMLPESIDESLWVVVDCENRPLPLLNGLITWVELDRHQN